MPQTLREKDFGVIGVVGTDYASFSSIRKVMREFARVGDGKKALRSGYPIFLSIIREVVEKWRGPAGVTVNLQKGLKSPRFPRNLPDRAGCPKAVATTPDLHNVANVSTDLRRQEPENQISEGASRQNSQTNVFAACLPNKKSTISLPDFQNDRLHVGSTDATGSIDNAAWATFWDEFVSTSPRQSTPAVRSRNSAHIPVFSDTACSPISSASLRGEPRSASSNTVQLGFNQSMCNTHANAELKLGLGQRTVPLREISPNLPQHRLKGGETPLENGSLGYQEIKGDCANGHVIYANSFEDISQDSASGTNPRSHDSEEPDTRTPLYAIRVFESSASLRVSPMPEINDYGAGWVEDEQSHVPPSPDWLLPFSPFQTRREGEEFPGLADAARNSINDIAASRNVSHSSSSNTATLELDGPASDAEETSPATNHSEPAVRLGDEGFLSVSANLPFGLSRVINRNVPLRAQSLKDLTAKLLCARQRGRVTDWTRMWEIHLQPHLMEETPFYYASFDGQIQDGLRLVPLDIGDESSPISYKTCAYGCTKNGIYRWICNTMYILSKRGLTIANNVATSVPRRRRPSARTFSGPCLHLTVMTFSLSGVYPG